MTAKKVLKWIFQQVLFLILFAAVVAVLTIIAVVIEVEFGINHDSLIFVVGFISGSIVPLLGKSVSTPRISIEDYKL